MEKSKMRELLDRAIAVYESAYAPYSNVHVGAALLTSDNQIFTGVNIENASFGATNCAERTAIFKAVSEGKLEIKAIAVASNLDDVITPCGICRQVMTEFMTADSLIILGDKDKLSVHTLEEILPLSFSKADMGERDGI